MPPFAIPGCPSPQMKAVLHYLNHLEVFNLQKLGKFFVDDFVQSMLPLSLGIPSRTKEEDLAFLKGLADRLGGRSLEITIYDIIESPGKAWAHLLLHAEPQDGKTFHIECIYQFTFAEHLTTPKFKSLVEFVDSKAFASMG